MNKALWTAWALITLTLLFGVPGQAQNTLSVSVDKALVDAGEQVTVTVTFSGSGAPAVSGLQWTLADGPWVTTVPGKDLHCNGATCLLVGLNADPIPDGVVASATFTINQTRNFVLGGPGAGGRPLGVAPDGTAVAVDAGALVQVAIRLDLNRDGPVDDADVALAIQQALGLAPCQDIDGDGACTVIDVQRIVNGRN